LDALAAIEAAAFDPKLYAGSTMSRRSFAAHIRAKCNPLFVAVEKNRPACGYALGFVREGSAYVRFYSLAILPEHAGKGAGRLLFQAMERFARRHRYRGLRLEVRADNRRLLDRYRGLGYRVFDEVGGYYADGCAAIRMTRDF
jgi:ribosomal protein S18 acetylase RimI-like enzyme